MQILRLVFAITAIIIYILVFPHVINRYKFFIEREQTMIQQLTSVDG